MLRDLPLDGSSVVVAAARGGCVPDADESIPARAALISCCTISRTELSEGAEMIAAGCADDVPDEVGRSVAGGGSWPSVRGRSRQEGQCDNFAAKRLLLPIARTRPRG